MQKKILFLGGSHFQLPPIEYARKQGHYVITCDYLPQNPGHRHADEYHNVSTTDLSGVLELARRLGIHGIVAYGSDPAAATAAYVAEQLGLPGNPYRSVCILARKDLFRQFLRENGFHTPRAEAFTRVEEAEAFLQMFRQPMILKPVDSSGSRGICRVDSAAQLRSVFPDVLSYSRAGKVILEEIIIRKGYQIAGDGFVAGGRLVFRGFAQEHFREGGDPLVPIGESYPLLLPAHLQQAVHDEIDRLVRLLGLRSGALNLDIMLDERDRVYLIEIAPRAGGNLITEMIRMSTGVHLVKYVVEGALGSDCSSLAMQEACGCCGLYVFNAESAGIFKTVELDASLQGNVVEQKLFVEPGTRVQPYKNSGGTLGCLILRFGSPGEMLEKMDTMRRRVRVRVE